MVSFNNVAVMHQHSGQQHTYQTIYSLCMCRQLQLLLIFDIVLRKFSVFKFVFEILNGSVLCDLSFSFFSE